MNNQTSGMNNVRDVLIVEDSPTQAEQLRYILERNHYHVNIAQNGKEALLSLKQHKPFIVISDIIMPEMDGYELCHQIKSDKTLKDIPVILLTSLADPADIVRGLLCAADNFIVKPYDEKYLLSRIEYIFANRELRKHEKSQLGVELYFAGQRHSITSDRLQILDLLISTYETAVEKNRELIKAQDELKKLNEQLEGKVQERTAALTQEIGERKKTEEALRESGMKFRTVWEKAKDGMRITDEEGAIILVNDAYCAMVEKRREEIVGKPMSIVVEKAKQAETLRKHQDRFRSRSVPLHLERDIALWNGKRMSLELSNTFLEIPHQPVLLLSVFRDITERKRAVEALKKAEEKYRSIFENAIEGIFQSTPEGRFLDVNPAFAHMLGYESPKEVIKFVTDIGKQLYVHPERRDEMKLILMEKGVIYDMQHQWYRKDKAIIWVSENVRVVNDEHGKLLYYEGITQDITEHKKLQEQLLRNQRLESIGILAGGIAHDLNNVLAPIMMSVQILKQQNTDHVSQRILTTLEASAKRGAGIIRQVLTFARGADGERGVLQSKHLLHEIENFVKETFPKTIQIDAHSPADLKMINGDATQLYQVLLNLCLNARDAMLSGGTLKLDAKNIVLDENYLRLHADARPGPYVQITVSDTGIGIPPELVSKIFDPFFTTKELGKGTGLGLSTVLGIVKSHGGFITVYSEVGKGTRFNIYFPAAEPVQVTKGEPKREKLPLGRGELVLVVDDEASIREMAKAALEVHGYKVLLAENGFDAVSKFRQQQDEIRLIITDMAMPEMDGPATIREIRKISPAMKIIGASGLTSSADLAQVAAPDVQAFLSKPYSVEQLLTALDKLFQQS